MANEPKNEGDLKAKGISFGRVAFTSPENRRKIEKWGRTSCIVLQATVPLTGTGLVIECGLWAERKTVQGATEIHFEASLPRGLKVDPREMDADAIRDAFKAHVETAALKFPGYDAATNAAAALLLDTKPAAIKGAAPKVERTRLVYKPQSERPASEPAQTA